ncbi:glutathione S-transferase [Permianibacter sp. IMCC34836]|uniref:glutathione S-transferase N-terminal domain-containing protein n=1 Tax=Permianibacter fluminis TaxID=2738515 RepID=UPI0015565F98|nr:glutathione S-transferase N-terminal domain-containing protein [Permianibacter fluminis]NQD35505.1 glutathione S-transferase [Permianibacter fluminis]
MKLFYSHASPYARCCRVLRLEKQLATQVEEVLVDPLQNPAELIVSNPLGKIPCLLLDDGDTLYDSTVINDYFNSLGQGPDLLAAHKTSWQVRKWQALSQGMLDVAVALRIEKTKPEPQQSGFWMERQRAALKRGLATLQADRALMPAEPGLLDLHMACMLAYLAFRHEDLNWQQDYDRLADWYRDISQRPSLVATEPK